jgi:hypothetical protein
MDKKTFIATIAITVLLFSLVGMQLIEVAKANPLVGYNGPPFPNIGIHSPTNQTIYNSTEIPLEASVLATRSSLNVSTMQYTPETAAWLKYEIDGVSYSFTDLTYISPSTPYCTWGSAHLTQLSDGVHFLTVYGETTLGTAISSNVTFWVHEAVAVPTPSPSPTPVPSPTQGPTPSPSSPLTPQPSATSEPLLEPTQTPIPTSDNNQKENFTPLILAAVVVIAAAAVGALVYFRRRKGWL